MGVKEILVHDRMQCALFFNTELILINQYEKYIFFYLMLTKILQQFRKTHRFPLIQDVSLDLFSLQWCLLFFLKTMKLYKDIWSALISCICICHFFFSQIDIINISKILWICCYFMEKVKKMTMRKNNSISRNLDKWFIIRIINIL